MPSMGQAIASTRALTAPRGTVPLPASVRWAVESREPLRSSPSRKSRPLGTVTSGIVPASAGSPGRRYGSSIFSPLTVSLPSVQQATVSPPTATTRLTIGRSPQLACLKTTTSPRSTSPPPIRSARTRSPAAMVGDMESVGTVYGW